MAAAERGEPDRPPHYQTEEPEAEQEPEQRGVQLHAEQKALSAAVLFSAQTSHRRRRSAPLP
ncbi:hypothetical protein AA0313_2455 [Acetobacter indonesiensis NRIC 0313]|nr:hypothetical protein AA0313_2455 [Acetobacter indonesiensis NRIC 0313]